MNLNATLLGQAITFGLFIWFTMRFVWPPVMKAIEGRQGKIADGLIAAQQSEQLLQTTKETVQHQLQEARTRASDILSHANTQAEALLQEVKITAQVLREKEVTVAKAEIARLTFDAREALKADVVGIAVRCTEKVLARQLTEADQNVLLSHVKEALS